MELKQKQRRAMELGAEAENVVDEYLKKAAEGYTEDVKEMAKCVLAARCSGCRGACFILPDIGEV